MEKREFLFLKPGFRNPEFFVEGRARERAKAERPTEAFDRYFQMLRQRKISLEEEKPVEKPRPRVKQPIYPVENWESPVIISREK